MGYELRLLPRAERDAQAIFDYLVIRSPAGAESWWDAFEAAGRLAAATPLACGLAPESPCRGIEVRQKLFKTKRGRVYRFVFAICDEQVRILRVRGPGQKPLEADEIEVES